MTLAAAGGRIEQNDVVVRLDRLQRFGEAARISDRDRSIEIPIGRNQINTRFARRTHGGDEIGPRLAKCDVAGVFGVRRTNEPSPAWPCGSISTTKTR